MPDERPRRWNQGTHLKFRHPTGPLGAHPGIALAIKFGQFTGGHEPFSGIPPSIKRDQPVEDKDLRPLLFRAHDKTCSQVRDFALTSFHHKANPLRRHMKLQVTPVKKNSISGLHGQRKRCGGDGMHAAVPKGQFDNPFLHGESIPFPQCSVEGKFRASIHFTFAFNTQH